MSADPQPHPPPVWLLTAAEMREWDRRAVEGMGIPERLLMESAGRSAAEIVHRLHPRGTIAAAVGAGNNGGDALVLLRCLRAWGRDVVAVPVGGATVRPELLHGWEVPIAGPAHAAEAFRDSAAIVDGILGTGATGEPRAPQAAAIRALMAAGRPIVALDGPSGVDLTTGAAPGDAVTAHVTVTFGAPKRGLLLFPGRRHAGRLLVVEVGFPPLDRAGACVITHGWTIARLPRLPVEGHKGNAGRVVVVAGHPGMGGAAILAAMGALRAGAGGVRVVSHEANRVPVQTAVPEALFVDRASDSLDEVVASADSLVVGPGMATDDESLALLRRILSGATGPVLLDADALTLLAREPDLVSGAGRVLLTPHPGEMSRLLGRETPEIVADPFGAAADAVERFGCPVLLKGNPSLVAAPGEPTLVNVAGHSGLATGGMGDTLAGVCGAFLAAGAAPRDAAGCALLVSGRAAEVAGRGRSLLPRDVAEALPRALARPGEMLPPGILLDVPAPR